MTSGKAGLLTAVLAFAAGVAVGVLSDDVLLQPVGPARRAGRDGLPCDRDRGSRGARALPIAPVSDPSMPASTSANGAPPPETTVEVTYADSPSESSSEIIAAHRLRQAKRTAVREMAAENRRDFLSSVNLELLSDAQRKLHAEYTEAVAERDAVRQEIRALRAKGDEVPDALRKRLADAESVIRADVAAEHRTLREAAARAHGLDDAGVEALLEDLDSIDRTDSLSTTNFDILTTTRLKRHE